MLQKEPGWRSQSTSYRRGLRSPSLGRLEKLNSSTFSHWTLRPLQGCAEVLFAHLRQGEPHGDIPTCRALAMPTHCFASHRDQEFVRRLSPMTDTGERVS